METVNAVEKSSRGSKKILSNSDTDFDWYGFGLRALTLIAEGACFAIGGIAISMAGDALRVPPSTNVSSSENVISLGKKASSSN